MAMKIIAVAVQKGGVGKSTITRTLGTAAASVGINVLLIDMDNQQTTTMWSRRRQATFPLVKFTTENDLADELKRAQTAGCELVIIDTPPARSTEAPAAVEVADLVLIPCTADVEAFEQLPRTARLARTTGKPDGSARGVRGTLATNGSSRFARIQGASPCGEAGTYSARAGAR
jgi:chromosome partitioning protein